MIQRDTEAQRHRDTVAQRHRDTASHSNTEAQRYRGTAREADLSCSFRAALSALIIVRVVGGEVAGVPQPSLAHLRATISTERRGRESCAHTHYHTLSHTNTH